MVAHRSRNAVRARHTVAIRVAADNAGIRNSRLRLKDAGKYIIAELGAEHTIIAPRKRSGLIYRAKDKAVADIQIGAGILARQIKLILGDLAVISSGHDRGLIGFVVLCV